jgi:predicted site-specific integrase-resolvase
MTGKEAMKIIGCSYKTLQRYRDKGLLRSSRLPNGTVDWWEEDVYGVIGRKITAKPRKCVAYARVNLPKYEKELKQQVLNLKNWSNKAGVVIDKLYTDISPGTTFSMTERPDLHDLLQSMFRGEISTSVIDSVDRIARVGYEIIKAMCVYYGVEIVVLNPAIKDPHYEKEQTEDIVKLLQQAGVSRLSDLVE